MTPRSDIRTMSYRPVNVRTIPSHKDHFSDAAIKRKVNVPLTVLSFNFQQEMDTNRRYS